MRIVLGAVGRLKAGAERTLFDRYWERLEVSGRAVGLLTAAGEQTVLVALDERGKSLTSPAFADLLKRHRDDGCKDIAFLIGGPDGHGPAVIEAARVKLSLSAMTLPHGLARVVLAEQLYRAVTILSGHPYHRV
jgi:23S rRNA (pseudouridine1915-N3)-methyltransferase